METQNAPQFVLRGGNPAGGQKKSNEITTGNCVHAVIKGDLKINDVSPVFIRCMGFI